MARSRSLGSKFIDELVCTDADAHPRVRVVTLDCRRWVASGSNLATLQTALTVLGRYGAFIAYFRHATALRRSERDTLSQLVRVCRDRHYITMVRVDMQRQRRSRERILHLDALPFDLLLIDIVSGVAPPSARERGGGSGRGGGSEDDPRPRWVALVRVERSRLAAAVAAVQQWSARADAIGLSLAPHADHERATLPAEGGEMLGRAIKRAKRQCLLLTELDALFGDDNADEGPICESPRIMELTPSGMVRSQCPKIDIALRQAGGGGEGSAPLTGGVLVERFASDRVGRALEETHHCPDRSRCQYARSELYCLAGGVKKGWTSRLARSLRYPSEALRWLLRWRL